MKNREIDINDPRFKCYRDPRDDSWTRKYFRIYGTDEFLANPWIQHSKIFYTSINGQIFSRPGDKPFKLNSVFVEGHEMVFSFSQVHFLKKDGKYLDFEEKGEIRITNFKEAFLDIYYANGTTGWSMSFLDFDTLNGFIYKDGKKLSTIKLVPGETLSLSSWKSDVELDFNPKTKCTFLQSTLDTFKKLINKT